MYKRERSQRDATLPQRRKTPSFSSSLLDSIYRSIDESNPPDHRPSGFSPEPVPAMVKKQTIQQDRARASRSPHKLSSLQRAIMIEEWMEKQNTLHFDFSLNSASISSSSESSSGVTFSSSDAQKKKRLDDDVPGSGGGGGGFSKTKLRALKIYGELKKVKQPISPGGRISTFLNSIFNSGNVKKAKMCYVGAVDDVSFERKSKSACSSASSFSRSCMSKSEHSSRNKIKRSVRFYPVSVIVGEDSRPCGHKPIYYEDIKKNPSMSSSSIKNRDFMTTCKKKKMYNGFYEDDDYDELADTESCASSDLFELDHLIGIGRYREELPVYETTCLKKNQAIANSLKL